MTRLPERLPPQDQAIYQNASGLIDSCEYDEAILLFDELIDRHVDLFELSVYRGYCWFKLGRHAKAIEDFDRMVEGHSRSPNTLYLRARCKEELALAQESEQEEIRFRREAMRDYQAVIDVAPETADAHRNLALLLEFEERPDAALETYEKSHELDPDNEFVRKRLASLRMGKTFRD